MKENKIKAFVIDDEENATLLLEKLLSMNDSVESVESCRSPVDALARIIRSQPDVIFLDVEMPHMNGFEFLGQLRDLQIDTRVIFVTGHSKYSIPALRHSAVDFLLKPIDPAELTDAINKLLSHRFNHSVSRKIDRILNNVEINEKLRFSTRSGFILVHPDNIVCFRADGNYSELIGNNGKKEILSINIGSLENLLPERRFFRINRSVIINLSYLSKVDRKAGQCFLEYSGQTITFCINRKRIKELETAL